MNSLYGHFLNASITLIAKICPIKQLKCITVTQYDDQASREVNNEESLDKICLASIRFGLL